VFGGDGVETTPYEVVSQDEELQVEVRHYRSLVNGNVLK
jgi:hypothetical protein